MNVYTIYNKEFTPESLLAKHPNAPIYHDDSLENSIDVILFVSTLEEVTGTAADNVILIDQTEEELSNEELDAMVDQYLTGEQHGSELQIIKPRGTYIYNTRFKKQEVLN